MKHLEPLLTPEQIQRRVQELGATISAHYGDEEIVLLIVLKGSVLFGADLARRITSPVVLDFIRARSYAGTASTGRVEVSLLPESPLEGRHVVLVEDILDTGTTAAAILNWLAKQHPASLKVCALLDKPARRVQPVHGDFIGFEIEDRFVVGYGLDYEERYRNLEGVWVLGPQD